VLLLDILFVFNVLLLYFSPDTACVAYHVHYNTSTSTFVPCFLDVSIFYMPLLTDEFSQTGINQEVCL